MIGPFRELENSKHYLTRYFFIILASLIALSACNANNTSKARLFQVSELYRIKASAGASVFLSVVLPVSYGYQSIEAIEVKNVDDYYFEDKEEYKILYAELKGNNQVIDVEINYKVSLANQESTWEMDNKPEYLSHNEIIDTDHQNIIEATSSLIVKDDDYLTAQKILSFVSEAIKFDDAEKINKEMLSASDVLDEGKGVCHDYANLSVAMLRNAGIPARVIEGLVYNDLKKPADWSSSAGAHAWVEFNTSGKWHFADPTWGKSYFAKPDGYHLSYGVYESSMNVIDFKSIEDDGYKILGAMTAPIRFTAWSDDSNATIKPKVVVK